MMNMISKKKSKAYIVFVVISMIVFVIFHVYDRKESAKKTYVSEIQVAGGWGYEVIYNNKVLIIQEYIPAISGEYPFQTKQEALSIGSLALKRFIEIQRPAITMQDLDSLLIKYPD